MKLAVDVDFDELSFDETCRIVKSAGFDGAFAGWNKKGDAELAAELFYKHGLIHQSVHAPFSHISDMWTPDYNRVLERQIECLEETARCGVGITVSHVFIGFGKKDEPNEWGLESFGKYLDRAEKLGVYVAFENTEGEGYLNYLLEHFKERKICGYCWDSGHEQCYSRGKDLLALYGDRLLCTHLNDNLGVTGEEITFYDDAHLLPFDGIIDWKKAAEKLKKSKPLDILSFELVTKSRPNRHTHDIYNGLSPEQYMEKAYKAAKKISLMME